ncbi:hypothetical protein JCM11641_001431 [Rhodosporidiobolus odoratus]
MHRSSSQAEPSPSTSSASATIQSTTSPDQAYSLPLDAFSDEVAASRPPPSSGSRGKHPASFRTRQRQHLTDSEAQAFADLLGEILPRSMGTQASPASSPGSGGIFDILNSRTGNRASPVPSGVSKVQEALMKKVGRRMGMRLEEGSVLWERKTREQLTEEEELQLDRLREELMGLKTDRQVLLWGMRNVFGYDEKSGDVFPDPAGLSALPTYNPVLAAPLDNQASTAATVGPSSRIYPDLLLLLFLVLRDTHQAPATALSVFSLAASNPYSYINGCTTALYTEVLSTRWAQGDVESVLSTLEEMRASGLRIDSKVRELVRAVGEAIRIDGDRAEMRVDYAILQKEIDITGSEKEREIERRRFFGDNQRAAWARMEQIVEEADREVEQRQKAKADDRRREEYASLADFSSRFDAAHGEPESRYDDSFPSPYALPPRSSASPYDEDRSRSFSPRDRDRGRGQDRERSRGFDFGQNKWSPEVTRDADGNLVLPKRPSFANPFKIRRKGLSKEEKAAKDAKHPALWWKQ